MSCEDVEPVEGPMKNWTVYVVGLDGSGHALETGRGPDAATKIIADCCRDGVHAQTFEAWDNGVGPGSAKWLGMSCLCGDMRWDYPSALSGVHIGQWVDR